ncbi:hypothetical protein TrRE_jg4347, partial [Triparma retinervis]
KPSSQYQYESDSSGSDYEGGHLYPKQNKSYSDDPPAAPAYRKKRDKHAPPPSAPPSHTRSHPAPATSPLTEPDMNTSQYDSDDSEESDESDDEDIDFSPEKSIVSKKEPFYTPKQQQQPKNPTRTIDPVSDSEKLAVASQLPRDDKSTGGVPAVGGSVSSRLSPAVQSAASPLEEER